MARDILKLTDFGMVGRKMSAVFLPDPPPGMVRVVDFEHGSRLVPQAEADESQARYEAAQAAERDAYVAELAAKVTPGMTPEQIIRLVLEAGDDNGEP